MDGRLLPLRRLAPLGAILALVALGVVLWSRLGGPAPVAVDTVAPARLDLAATLELVGKVVNDRTVTITALLDGEITAIGAREGDILAQFLLEAVLIAVVGGALGLAIGALASVVLAAVTGFPLIPSPVAIGGALAVSVAVGVLSGFLPARRAARLHPVEALRSE